MILITKVVKLNMGLVKEDFVLPQPRARGEVLHQFYLVGAAIAR
jgi:hypothetical protein